MDEEIKAASAAAFLYRYLLARAEYRSVDPAVQRLSEADLACHIGRKRREFDCPASAPMRQNRPVEEGRISGPS